MSSSFVPLRVHTEYSFEDSIIRIEALCKKLKALNQYSCAITDFHNMHGVIDFYQTARKYGIKPILGVEISVEYKNKQGNVVALAMNNNGYFNIIKLVSNLRLKPENNRYLSLDEMLSLSDDVIFLIPAENGLLFELLLVHKNNLLSEIIDILKTKLKNRLYLEIEKLDKPNEEDYLLAVTEFASKHNIPLVATNKALFLTDENAVTNDKDIKQVDNDYEMQIVRSCISDGTTTSKTNNYNKYTKEQFLPSAELMHSKFKDYEDAIENTVEISKRCSVEITLYENFLPTFQTPNNESEDDYLIELSHIGLKKRLQQYNLTAEKLTSYTQRLDFELQVINSMGFAGYFLIVMDFIKWAKTQNIPVGPGRGSGAGSVAAWSLEITDLDPLKYDLLFERFLNPERVSMPDFDIDFCMDGRDKVIKYVTQKYGKNAVGQIATFGTMSARAVVRDVARAQGKPYAVGDKISKLIPKELDITLDKAKEDKNLDAFLKEDAEANEVYETSLKLEGLNRNTGKHAGGIVISKGDITNFVPIMQDEDGDIITQFDKDNVEKAGLVKFDFLGLRTLTVINNALQEINKQQLAKSLPIIDINAIDLEDKQVFELLRDAKTKAVFQLESGGMRDLILKLKPDCLEDIIALVALFRPGPLNSGMSDDFAKRKNGDAKIYYPAKEAHHESLKPILETTYGVIVYQEQVMQIAQKLAGYTLGGADLLRRAMGKKKQEEMDEQRQIFIDGCIANKIDKDLAGKIFDLVDKFAGYGFNKSHSAAYGLISYQTAYLKTHFKEYFMAAVMSADMQNSEEIYVLIKECHNLGIKVTNPDINTSNFKFIVHDKEISYGLGAIKGIGFSFMTEIVTERNNNGKFKNILDLFKRVSSRSINKKTMEALIYSGSLDSIVNINDSIQKKRAILIKGRDYFTALSERYRKEQSTNQKILFDAIDADSKEESTNNIYVDFLDTKPLTSKAMLDAEYGVFGFYLTAHPIEIQRDMLAKIPNFIFMDKLKDGDNQLTAGIILQYKKRNSKKGTKFITASIADKNTQMDALIPIEYEKDIVKGKIYLFRGNVKKDEYSGGLSLSVGAQNNKKDKKDKKKDDSMVLLDAYKEKHVKSISLKIKEATQENIQQLLDIINRYDASKATIEELPCIKLTFFYQKENLVAKLITDPEIDVYPTEQLFEELDSLNFAQLIINF